MPFVVEFVDRLLTILAVAALSNMWIRFVSLRGLVMPVFQSVLVFENKQLQVARCMTIYGVVRLKLRCVLQKEGKNINELTMRYDVPVWSNEGA